MNTEIFTWLTIESETLTVEQMSTLDTPPDMTWRIGDAVRDTRIVRRRNGIAYGSSTHPRNDPSLEDGISAVLAMLTQGDKLKLRQMCGVEITLHVAMYSSCRLAISLSPRVLGEILSVGAWLDVDTYVIDDD